MKPKILIVKGDIVNQSVDAIVNSANNSLLGGGGVDGAIQKAAGPYLLEECRMLGSCPTGQARITKGYDLTARWVIHAVGPVWKGGGFKEDVLLAEAYRSIFRLVSRYDIRSLALPSISTGAYKFPIEKASRIALVEIKNYLAKNLSMEKVLVVCFDQNTYDIYQKGAVA